jgi:plasmid stabilization system protein ParE
MNYSIAYQERALKEYESALEWYRDRSEIAAINFEIAVKEKINLLRINPESFKKTYRQFHEIFTGRYPYCIIYLIDKKTHTVIISSIFHHKRNPRIKYRNKL